MSQDDVRLSPELIAQLNKLASRLTAQGEYEAVDLIDTVVARVTAMPGRELLREALDAFVHINAAIDNLWNHPDLRHVRADIPESIKLNISKGQMMSRAAADKIRAALTQEKQT